MHAGQDPMDAAEEPRSVDPGSVRQPRAQVTCGLAVSTADAPGRAGPMAS